MNDFESTALVDQVARVGAAQHLWAMLKLPDPISTLLSLDARHVPLFAELLHLKASSNLIDADHRKLCVRVLRSLVEKHGILAMPPSLLLNNVVREGIHPRGGGSYADIWKGVWGEQSVCLKVLRIHLESDERKREKVVLAFCKEAMVWTRLRHPNILPLLGVNVTEFLPAFCFISPWMEHGDIICYLKRNPDHDRLKSVYEIASGLAYLHALKIIHGDIKGANVLVDDDHCCRLADFGLATVAETQRMDSTTSTVKGTVRWMAPELFVGGGEGARKKWSTDIYAYASTVYEIMTGHPPFPNLNEPAVIFKVASGKRPTKPSKGWCPKGMWTMVELCWTEDPFLRPRAAQIKEYLSKLVLLESNAGHLDGVGANVSPASPVMTWSLSQWVWKSLVPTFWRASTIPDPYEEALNQSFQDIFARQRLKKGNFI
ncbi:kinase-like protein [Moniliophthora roreri MCA 2997]|uniref:Kinase-like protein n=1 Tax=Moniliophthora roreri (strain MCA 2997) TaxID=1381753 RepID=V2WWP9_MONRO|nr:kinase-like protein [Moniliophthora roreri MCA 2997]